MEKVARICWNTRDWKRPSGSEGKSLNKSTYENILKFGHEEWLLDDRRVMPDGYHYAFVQPINTKSQKYAGKVFDIHLFTFHPQQKVKVYVGCLHNVECITSEQSHQAYSYYRKVGWLREMKEDVTYAGGTVKNMDANSLMFNIRFRFADADIKYSNRPIIAKEDPNTQGLYYTLMDKKGEFIFEEDDEGEVKMLNSDMCDRAWRGGSAMEDPVHKQMQSALAELLKDEYEHLYLNKDNVCMKGILKNSLGEWHYFELKTSSAKQNIREALGRLLEYNHYPSRTRAKKLYIVGNEAPDEKDCQYLKKLRDTYKLPVWYRWYSFEKNQLSQEF